MKKTKRSLITSLVTLLLCSAMFVGSTFAWFTDTVSNTGNRIQAGTLEVDLLMDKGSGYESIADGEGDIFKSEASIAQNSNDTLWEPGKTQFVKLAVQNNGNLAIKYNILIDVKDEGLCVGSESGKTSLEYAVFNFGHVAPTADQDPSKLGNWEAIKTLTGVITGDVEKGSKLIALNGCLDEIAYDSSKTNERDYFILAVHMKDDAGNEYRGKDAIIDVKVVAGQATAEKDGFDNNQYDVDSIYADIAIAKSEPSLSDYFQGISDGEEELPERVVVVEPTTLKAISDGPCKGLAPEFDGVKITLDLQSVLAVGEDYAPDGNNFGALRVQGQSGRFSEVTITGNKDGVLTSVGSNACAPIYCEGEFTLNITGGLFEGDYAVIAVNKQGGSNPNQTINISGGTFKIAGTDKGHIVPLMNTNPNAIIWRSEPPKLNITGGKFYNCDPTDGLAPGYKVTSEIIGNDKVYSVVPE